MKNNIVLAIMPHLDWQNKLYLIAIWSLKILFKALKLKLVTLAFLYPFLVKLDCIFPILGIMISFCMSFSIGFPPLFLLPKQ